MKALSALRGRFCVEQVRVELVLIPRHGGHPMGVPRVCQSKLRPWGRENGLPDRGVREALFSVDREGHGAERGATANRKAYPTGRFAPFHERPCIKKFSVNGGAGRGPAPRRPR